MAIEYYEKVIKDIENELGGYGSNIEYMCREMVNDSLQFEKEKLDYHFMNAMHSLLSYWNRCSILIKARTNLKHLKADAKAKSGAVYGKAALEAGKEDNDESCIGDSKGI